MARSNRKRNNRLGVSWSKFFSARNEKKAEATGAEATPVAAHAFSGNLLIVLAIIAFVILLSWGSLRTYFVQKAEINQVQENIAQLQQQNTDLNNELNLWKDDNYVKQQAKSRLFYVSEGETPYMVTGTDYSSSLADDTSAVALSAPQESWTDTLWASFQESSLEGQEIGNDAQPSADPSASTTPSSTETAPAAATSSNQ